MARLTDEAVLQLVHELSGDQTNAVNRVLSVVDERVRAGVAIRLTEGECLVLIAAAAGEPVPPHPYRGQWHLTVILACKESACPFCDRSIRVGAEIAHWPLTRQWGHRPCVEALAEAEPPTKERARNAAAVATAMGKARRARGEP